MEQVKLTSNCDCVDSRLQQFQAAYIAAGDDKSKLSKVALEYPDKWGEFAAELAKEGESVSAINHFQLAADVHKHGFVRACAVNEIGRIHANSGQTTAALGHFKQALSFAPDHAGIMCNIGLCHRWQGRLDEAERWLKRALKVNPWESNAALELSFVKMLQGDYLDGFKRYETRFRTPGGALTKLVRPFPEWDGTNGTKLLVYGEQGSGDIFLMLRYAKLIKERGVHQSWVVHAPMLPLVKTVADIDYAFEPGGTEPDFDCHIPAASLPRLFETTLKNIPPAKCIPMPDAVDYGDGFHVGIVWRGSKAQANDAIRSTNLNQWLPVLNTPGVTFHSLQVDGAEERLAYPQITASEPPKDWLETARRVAGLDLVISVDTSMVHLCGSMGVPCWCALHCRPYFVYPLVTEDCPWYPSVKLFKQEKEYEWQPVFERIAGELCNLMKEN